MRFLSIIYSQKMRHFGLSRFRSSEFMADCLLDTNICIFFLRGEKFIGEQIINKQTLTNVLFYFPFTNTSESTSIV